MKGIKDLLQHGFDIDVSSDLAGLLQKFISFKYIELTVYIIMFIILLIFIWKLIMIATSGNQRGVKM